MQWSAFILMRMREVTVHINTVGLVHLEILSFYFWVFWIRSLYQLEKVQNRSDIGKHTKGFKVVTVDFFFLGLPLKTTRTSLVHETIQPIRLQI